LWGPHPRSVGGDGSDRDHSFLIGLLPLGQPCSGFRAARLDHRYALTVDRRHQDRADGSGNRALLVESVKVPSRIRQDLLQTAFGDGNAGRLGNGLHRFQKRVLYGGLDQAALEFVGKRPCGQGQGLVERKDARPTGLAGGCQPGLQQRELNKCVKLSPEAAPLYRSAAHQYRKLKTLLNRLDKLSKTILRH